MLRMVSMLYSARWGLEKCSEKFIRINAVYGGLLCIINTISSILVFPKALIYDNGVSPIFILGGDNTSIRLYILAVTFCVLASTRKTDCFTFIVWMSFTIFTFLRDIGTGKICLFIITLGIILFVIQDIHYLACNALYRNCQYHSFLSSNYYRKHSGVFVHHC